MAYAYRDRRKKKGDFRRLWITRISAAARLHEISYSRLMAGLKTAGVEINRKVLADLAVHRRRGVRHGSPRWPRRSRADVPVSRSAGD